MVQLINEGLERFKLPGDEKQLLGLLSEGDEDAFLRLYNHFRPSVFSTALRIGKSKDLAEEIVQEVFLKVWVKRHKMQHVTRFKDYLFVITRNHVFDELKKIAKEAVTHEELPENVMVVFSTDTSLMEAQNEYLLRDQLAQLPAQQQLIFNLSREEGKSYKEISEELNISKLTVKTHMKKALAFIRYRLANQLMVVVLYGVQHLFF